MLEQLKKANRMLLEAPLAPVQGDRFQPTGFADLGAATYQLANGTWKLLVESAQSVANRLEATTLTPDNELAPELAGLSYIRVRFEGDSDSTTNSLVEAHRLNSPFIITDKALQERFKEEAHYSKGSPLDWRKIARAVFRLDLNSLLHGLFLANLEDGRIKMARAISGFIEASDVREAVSGGVKNNPLDPTGKLRASEYDKDVYGNVPYQRVEYTAGSIKAYFNLDLGLLRSYDLGEDAWSLLAGLALLKVRRFLDSGLRLRTACDFKVCGPVSVTEPAGFTLPSEEALLSFCQGKIKAVRPMLADPPVTELTTQVKWNKKGKEESVEEDSDE